MSHSHRSTSEEDIPLDDIDVTEGQYPISSPMSTLLRNRINSDERISFGPVHNHYDSSPNVTSPSVDSSNYLAAPWTQSIEATSGDIDIIASSIDDAADQNTRDNRGLPFQLPIQQTETSANGTYGLKGSIRGPKSASETANEALLSVREGLSDALGAGPGSGSWFPTRRKSQHSRTASTNSQATTASRVSNDGMHVSDDSDMLGLVQNAQAVGMSEITDMEPTSPASVKYGDMLGDELSIVESALAVDDSAGRLSTRSSAEENKSVTRSIRSAVRSMSTRIASNDRDLLRSRERLTHSFESSESDSNIPEEASSSYVYSSRFESEALNDAPETGGPYSDPASAAAPTATEVAAISSLPHTRFSLTGTSLCIFTKENRLRRLLYKVLTHNYFTPFVFLVIVTHTVLVTYTSIHTDEPYGSNEYWGHHWFDFAFLAIFIFYTFEMVTKIIVSGFIINPDTPLSEVMFNIIHMIKNEPFIASRSAHIKTMNINYFPEQEVPPSVVRSFTSGYNSHLSADRVSRLAFLRSSWNRLDFLCIIFYWLYFIVFLTRGSSSSSSSVFRALSSLKILHWLNLTNGTTTILRSIKKAAPLLSNVALFIGVFWTIFALIGVQIFNSSFKRQCVWEDPDGSGDSYLNSLQFCGGYLDPITKAKLPYITKEGTPSSIAPKGYLCPIYSKCIELSDNPYNNTVSFDNILQSLELVFVIMGMNGFSDLMNYTSMSDHLASSIFFVAGVIILAWWMMSLFTAVISSSFAVIREESQSSAFVDSAFDMDFSAGKDSRGVVKMTSRRRFYLYFESLVIIWIFVNFCAQCFKTIHMTTQRSNILEGLEYFTTFLLVFDIIFRFFSYLPLWRAFFIRPENWIDLFLAIITACILLPVIHNSRTAYPWLTLFQICRIYRVIVAIRYTRDHWTKVLGKVYNLVNLIVFFLLMLFLCSLIATELLKGRLEDEYDGETYSTNFRSLSNSFASVYQIMTTEGWATVLYITTSMLAPSGMTWIAAVFFCAWFLFANAVITNLFIAAIQENFEVSDEAKRSQQIQAFAKSYAPVDIADNRFNFSDMFVREKRRKSSAAIGVGAIGKHGMLDLIHSDRLLDDFLTQPLRSNTMESQTYSAQYWKYFSFEYWKSKIKILPENNPFFSNSADVGIPDGVGTSELIERMMLLKNNQRERKRRYVQENPKFNRVLFCFSPSNPIRQFCQKIVSPNYGVRYDSTVVMNMKLSRTFSAFIMTCVLVMVLIACYTTPYFQKQYYTTRNCDSSDSHCASWNWMTYTDVGFATIFSIEATIKILADGFIYTPNAYLFSTWNAIDFFVLVTLWSEVLISFLNRGTTARYLRAFKAFRALRLLHVNESAKKTFHDIIIIGIGKIFGAAVVALTLILPFSLWGLNIFAGKLYSCTDTDNIELSQCNGEYLNAPFNWNVLSPRSYSTSGYSFDSFTQSLSILFQIISLEGWNDVLQSVKDVTGLGLNPQTNHSVFNGLFIYVFNFISIVFIATLFITVIMQNYSQKTGVGFLTADQRSFIEMQKILSNTLPSRRRMSLRKSGLGATCYRLAVASDGMLRKYSFGLIYVQLIVLVVDHYPISKNAVKDLNIVYAVLACLWFIYYVIRMIGLPWTEMNSYGIPWKVLYVNRWDILWFCLCTLNMILCIITVSSESHTQLSTANKVLMVLLIFQIFPRSPKLNQLVAATSASLPSILSLLFTWFVLFLVYAIALNQIFGLTRIGPNGSVIVNVRTIPKAMLLLFRMSCGEGWNYIMYDYMIEAPFCIEEDNYFDSDCGSKVYAYLLFMSWNIISMYIFTNMLVSLIFESFSYVYQQSFFSTFISHKTIRGYKDAWATVDPHSTGYIQKDQVGRLIGSLPEILRLRIYKSPYTYGEIRQRCKIAAMLESHGTLIDGVDISRLQKEVDDIDVHSIRRSREQFNLLYTEIMMSYEPQKGIPFSAPLTLIPYYKIPKADSYLKLDQFIQRRRRLKLIKEEILRQSLRDFIKMLDDRKSFLKASGRDGKFRSRPKTDIPQIVINSEGDSSLDSK
ncbi:Ion transport protein-domain-containing protein [Dipodascopsis uninucleata]